MRNFGSAERAPASTEQTGLRVGDRHREPVSSWRTFYAWPDIAYVIKEIVAP
jgi:hypothetical protein